MTLETQHKQYLEKHPGSTLTFDEWMETVMKPFAKDMLEQVQALDIKRRLKNTVTIEEICKVAGVHLSRVKGCYLFGSQVYGTANEDSDFDVILVANSSSPEREFKVEKLNVHVIVPDLFEKYAHDNHVKAIECLFAPEWAVILPYSYEFVYREKSFRHNFSHQVSNSWVKCMKKLAQGDYYVGTKSIFHALRIADFGVQFAQAKKIDFSSMNYVWKEISSREWTWEELKAKYQPLRNSKLTEFKKLTSK